MPRLRMIDVGLPYKKIMQGSKWIGRVYKNAQGTYTGTIGKGASRHEATAPTELGAFSEVGARFFGQPNAAALAAHNSDVRSARNRMRVNSGDAMREMLRQFARVVGGPGSVARVTARTDDGVAITVEGSEVGEDDFVPPRGRRH